MAEDYNKLVDTGEQYKNDAMVFNELVESIGETSDASKPPLRFNNFEGRHYDYDDLEKKLLGWK